MISAPATAARNKKCCMASAEAAARAARPAQPTTVPGAPAHLWSAYVQKHDELTAASNAVVVDPFKRPSSAPAMP
jgi:hypothetical protein